MAQEFNRLTQMEINIMITKAELDEKMADELCAWPNPHALGVRMTPETLAQSNQSESAQQKALFCWAALNMKTYPELRWLFHVPNGGARTGFAGARLKAEGARRGVWDLNLPVTRYRGWGYPQSDQWAGLWIEMKAPGLQNRKNGGLTDEQVEFGEFVKSQGYFIAVCYGWEEAKIVIETYLKY